MFVAKRCAHRPYQKYISKSHTCDNLVRCTINRQTLHIATGDIAYAMEVDDNVSVFTKICNRKALITIIYVVNIY